MKRLAVLGQPIAHSLSPAMHTAAFEALGMEGEWAYEAIELSPEDFAAGVERLAGSGYVGVNVTVPHKVSALALADEASAAARAIGAANTLSFSRRGIRADNTDAPGLIGAMPASPAGRRALVLGAGGAARAAVWALLEAGAEVSIHNRTRANAERLAAEIGGAVLDAQAPVPLDGFDVVVNATSVGLATGNAGADAGREDLKAMGISADGVTDRMVIVDMVYGTNPTELERAGRRAGADVVDGLEILVHQGAEAFRIWTDRPAPLEAMRRAIREPQR